DYHLEKIEAYTARGPTARASIRRSLWSRRLLLGAGYQFSYLSFVQISSAISEAARAELGLVEGYRLAMLEQNIAYDARDNPLTPRSGFYAEVRLEQAHSLWG